MTWSPDLARTPDCRCLAARREARALTRLYERRLRPHGLRATQFSILAALALKGTTPVGDLAEALGLERTTLTRSAALLERNGWVYNARPEDARERPLGLSPAGREKLEAALPAWKAAQEATGREFGDARRGAASEPPRLGAAQVPARFPGRSDSTAVCRQMRVTRAA